MSKWRGAGFTDGLIEACVYLAVVLTPILVDVNLQRIFVLPKVALIRLLATVIVAAWAYQTLTSRRWPSRRAIWRHPLAWPGLALGLTLVLSTTLSILPYTSLWGGFLRLQGLWTEASYAILGLGVAAYVGTGERLQRLVDLILLASWPVALYGLVQFVGLDPLSWVGYTGRILSTLGNPIFLGAYVALIVPLTLYRGLTLLADYRVQPTRPTRLGLVWVGTLLLAQALGLVLSQSRGPLLALLIELGLLVVFLTRRRAVVMGLFGVTAGGILLLVAVNVPGSPLRPVQDWPVVGRLTDWRDVNYRDVIWSHVVQLVEARLDRLVVGYGPETLDVALAPFYTTRLAYLGGQAQQIDRTHNALLEALVTTGLVGLAAQLWFFLAVAALGLASIGLLRTSTQRHLVYSLPVGLGLAGAAGTRLVTGAWTWSALAGGLGLLAGLGIVLWALIARPPPSWPDLRPGDYQLTICLLAGWLGHFAEAQFSPTAETVQLHVWVGLGMLIASARLPHADAPPERLTVSLPTGGDPGRRKPMEPGEKAAGDKVALLDALLIGLMTLALVIGLVDWAPPFSLNGHLGIVLGLALLTWGFAMLWHRWRQAKMGLKRSVAAPPVLWQVAYVSLIVVFGGLTLYVISQFVSRGVLPVVLVYLLVLGGLAGLAWLLSEDDRPVPSAPRYPLAASIISVISLGVVTWLVFLPHLADRYFALGRRLVGQGQTTQGVEALANARRLAPDQDVYFLISSDVLASVAAGLTDPAQQTAMFESARATAQRAIALKPSQPYHLANLAHVELRWAESAQDDAVKAAAIQRGLDDLARVSTALAFDPAIFDDWGYLYYLRHDFDMALAKYKIALELQPGRPQTYSLMGRAYRDAGDWAAAEESYRAAIQFDKDHVEAYSELTEFYLQQGRAADALPYAERAVQLAPTRYALHHTLAQVYASLGKNTDAAEQIRIALRYAPAAEGPKLRTFLQQLTGQ
ncbi:MAG: O-antigen ligase family protein [Anaerolineae bacterium]|nr:O-antigen ligase family protein [Anaerolineae bacterium]